ncbi:methyltransferase domain protein [Rhizoctonia solani]|uniref:Methyltransferase domain protein n=1 Tax=Rhizoctonia solani TaxID=456999 RepID=A0A8H8P869_9AGAM|nr:methyltransferase domain protein [Rhizoctonia solani]QRW26975.1 methyltransferase domain protein [Rhizoctonia solani]
MLEPAHTTKHLPFLHIPFREHVFVLAQADDGVSNGTTLWLGGQLLAAYIASLPTPPKPPLVSSSWEVVLVSPRMSSLPPRYFPQHRFFPPFFSLVLASLGYHVLATDGHPSVLALLTQNIQRNAQNLPGSVQVRELDWCVPPERWDWSDPSSITSPRAYIGDPELRVAPPVFDLIVTADTLYVPHLTPHLLRTLDHLQALTPVTGSSLSSPSSDSNHQPKVTPIVPTTDDACCVRASRPCSYRRRSRTHPRLAHSDTAQKAFKGFTKSGLEMGRK